MSSSDSEDFTDDDSYDETSNLQPEEPKWNRFKEIPKDTESGSEAESTLLKNAEKLLLMFSYTFTFLIIICASIVAKGCTFFMISQISTADRTNLPFCNGNPDSGYFIFEAQEKNLEVDFHCSGFSGAQKDDCDFSLGVERSVWLWCLFFAFSAPNLGTFLRSLRIWLFKYQKNKVPSLITFLFVLTMEILHIVGLSMLVFIVLPEMDSLRAMVLTSGIALIPSILLLLTRIERKEAENGKGTKVKIHWIFAIIDVIAILCQLSAVLLWPLLQWINESTSSHPHPWAIPVSLALISCAWWETYVVQDCGIEWMWYMKRELIETSRYFTYLIISPIKIVLFFSMMILIAFLNGTVTNNNENLDFFDIFFQGFLTSFGNHTYNVREVEETVVTNPAVQEGFSQKAYYPVAINDKLNSVYVLIIQIACAYGAYIFSKFASKVQIQSFSFAFPSTLVIPASILLLVTGCGGRANDSCIFIDFLPNNLFFECPDLGDFLSYSWDEDIWLFFLWFISFIWITIHIWFPRSTRLASTEQIFSAPWYEGLFIDQSLMLNRRKDGDLQLKIEEFREYEKSSDLDQDYEVFPEGLGKIRNTDKITKIYACATMWHETKEEMQEMIKSLFRIDEDYCARRFNQKFFSYVDQDYYEWETHILFDDAFTRDDQAKEKVVNQFVKMLVETLHEYAHFYQDKDEDEGIKYVIKPCKKYPTPYGGRLVWTLPGKTKIVCHLKDKEKIRHKKRWSQCMYMYYLLGFRLMNFDIDRQVEIAKNTYLLALDGDVDFQPQAIVRLVDLMKKNSNVGAACGRIHPTGSGYIPWYQKFEYAVGHWLQKSTEHILGCVLCSPGCFSLFRGQALMDHNVMRTYTRVSTMPRHYVQYDQGEDRWLCTLLLQQGWRVEYSAASDAFTACPETFEEFYNQRRRWMPSTIMNILDLLADYKNVVTVNPDISSFYILYQGMLMVSTFVGPGAIFLVLAGSLNTVFNVGIWYAILYNAIPVILFMLVCYYLDAKIQLSYAKLLTIGYVLLMLTVMIGIFIQIIEEGSLLSPTAVSFLSVFVSFFIAGVLHPYEISCLPYLVIYYITIPSMYLLLVIYSLFNLWNVSWGTREIVEKKSPEQIEAEKKAEDAKKKETSEGMLMNLLKQFNMSGGEGSETGGLEFSLANLFKCMCFTHEDPSDPKTQLVEIAASLEKVNMRLSNIESGNGGSIQRRSSFSNRRRMSAVPELINDLEAQEIMSQATENSVLSTNIEVHKETEGKRDDMKNPYWIEDFFPDNEDLKGKVDFLRGTEVVFWEKLIKEYLTPLTMGKADKDKQTTDLKAYRDQLIFTFIMSNLIWVLGITLMQQNKSILSINWFLDKKYNITYNSLGEQGPEISIESTSLVLEPIGLFFLLAFLGIMILQMVGMLLHRWTNFCHTIATTKLGWCERDRDAGREAKKEQIEAMKALQTDKKKKKRKGFDRKEGNNIHFDEAALRAQSNKKQAIDLEKKFMEKLNNEEAIMETGKRLSIRRETLSAINRRRDSFLNIERRRSTILERRRSTQIMSRKSFSSQGISNSAFDSDIGEEMSESVSTYRGSERGRNSLQFDTYVTTSEM